MSDSSTTTYLFTGYDKEDEQRHIHALLKSKDLPTVQKNKKYLCGRKVSKDSLPFESELCAIENYKAPMKPFPNTLCTKCEKVLEEKYPKAY